MAKFQYMLEFSEQMTRAFAKAIDARRKSFRRQEVQAVEARAAVEEVLAQPAIEAVEADPENGIEAVEAVDAVEAVPAQAAIEAVEYVPRETDEELIERWLDEVHVLPHIESMIFDINEQEGASERARLNSVQVREGVSREIRNRR